MVLSINLTPIILNIELSANNASLFLLSELEFEYDAFVIFSSQDSDWVIKTLIPTLEEKHDFKCCVHYRDFVIGVPLRENMVNSVYNSRKTIAVVSKNFSIVIIVVLKWITPSIDLWKGEIIVWS